MSVQNFYALDDGAVPRPRGRTIFDVDPGDCPVRVTVADVSREQDGSHEREAYDD
ncbi:hypothetical protein [Actinomyces israelii]